MLIVDIFIEYHLMVVIAVEAVIQTNLMLPSIYSTQKLF